VLQCREIFFFGNLNNVPKCRVSYQERIVPHSFVLSAIFFLLINSVFSLTANNIFNHGFEPANRQPPGSAILLHQHPHVHIVHRRRQVRPPVPRGVAVYIYTNSFPNVQILTLGFFIFIFWSARKVGYMYIVSTCQKREGSASGRSRGAVPIRGPPGARRPAGETLTSGVPPCFGSTT